MIAILNLQQNHIYINFQVNTRKLRSRRNAGRGKRFSGHSWAGSVVGAHDTDLVHLSKSPNYCRANDKKGILGTKVSMTLHFLFLSCKCQRFYRLSCLHLESYHVLGQRMCNKQPTVSKKMSIFMLWKRIQSSGETDILCLFKLVYKASIKCTRDSFAIYLKFSNTF